jgi:hypothetical protein
MKCSLSACLLFCVLHWSAIPFSAVQAGDTDIEDALWQALKTSPARPNLSPGEDRFEFGERINKQREKRLLEIIEGKDGALGLLTNELSNGTLTLQKHRVLRNGGKPTSPPGGSRPLEVNNLVLKLGSGTKPTVVIGAHLDQVIEGGQGVIDDWSGSVLIIHACKLLANRPGTLNHNFVFVCFAYEEGVPKVEGGRDPESGLSGSKTFVNDLKLGDTTLTPLIGGLHNVKAMVNIECLGVTGLYGWKEGSTKLLADEAKTVADRMGRSFVNRDIGLPVGADSVPFFFEGIPAITIDSLKAPNDQDDSHDFGKIHSEQDQLATIDRAKYVSTLTFAHEYLQHLDEHLHRNRNAYAGFRLSEPEPRDYPLVTRDSFGHGFHKNAAPHDDAAFQPVAGPLGPTQPQGFQTADGALIFALHQNREWVIVTIKNGKARRTPLGKIVPFEYGTEILPR